MGILEFNEEGGGDSGKGFIDEPEKKLFLVGEAGIGKDDEGVGFVDDDDNGGKAEDVNVVGDVVNTGEEDKKK